MSEPTLESRLEALLDDYPRVADRLFALQVVVGSVEDDANEAILRAVGADYADPGSWPCKDFTYDWYDGSFEFKGTTVGWEPTAGTLAAWAALGFARCWMCYTDGSEKYYDLRG